MVGGVVTSTMMELLVYPAIYYLWRSQALRGRAALRPDAATEA
jgi:Cu(I)/Ag(I) efflux system membrane protein CusA/SilA